jgi:hypothetical protein
MLRLYRRQKKGSIKVDWITFDKAGTHDLTGIIYVSCINKHHDRVRGDQVVEVKHGFGPGSVEIRIFGIHA